MDADEVNEKADMAMVIVNIVLWIVGVIFIFKGAHWLGGRWYHWILSFLIVGFVENILSAIIKVVVKAVIAQKAK